MEPPMNAKPYYNDMVKTADELKVFQDFKKPSQMTVEEYNSVPAKSNWNSNIKYCCHSINKESMDVPIRLCHAVMHTAFKLKIFGDDALGKVSTRCKVGASVINNLLEKNTVFFPSGSVRARLPFRARPLNEETFKSVVVELLKCSNDTNVQRHYVGDGEDNVELAGFSIPPAALTDGTKPGAETLFKLSLHEVKGLFESQLYLKNPNATDLATARLQAAVLDAIGCVANGQALCKLCWTIFMLPTRKCPTMTILNTRSLQDDMNKRGGHAST